MIDKQDTPIKTDRRRSPETKERILDAAEKLFAERGFHGASLRDITGACGVQVALSYYHFGSKEDVLQAVVDRRAIEHIGCYQKSLTDALARNDGKPIPVDSLIEAFVVPAIERFTNGDDGWKYYIQLLAHLSYESSRSSYAKPFFKYDDIVNEFISELKRSLPDVSAEDLHWSFYFLQSALTNAVLETQMIDRQSQNLCCSSDFDALIKAMKNLFSAGLLGLKPRM